uniref:Iodothyronine deiodinase n=2 Tax=Electrophorus electricus TaxID=8005 RepID=A0A4W4FRX7_ELEEL
MGTTIGYAIRRVNVYVSTLARACLALALSSLLKLLSVASPSLTKKIITSMGARSSMTQNPRFRYEDWGPSFVTLTFLKTVLEDLWCGLGEEAFEGYGAPDCALVTMGGRTSSVHQFLRGTRPLVLSFGSCT